MSQFTSSSLSSHTFFKVCVLKFTTLPASKDEEPALNWDGIPGMIVSSRTAEHEEMSSFERRARFFTRQENCSSNSCKPNTLRLLFILTVCLITPKARFQNMTTTHPSLFKRTSTRNIGRILFPPTGMVVVSFLTFLIPPDQARTNKFISILKTPSPKCTFAVAS